MKRIKRYSLGLVLGLFIVFCGFFLLDKFYPIETKMLEDTSAMMLFKNKNWAYVTTNKEQKWRFPIRLKEIDPQFIRLLLSYEDQRFYSHYGIDPLAMFRALGQWISHGRIVSGGSTITMQLAKLLHPRPRTLSAKFIEIFRAIQLEYHYSKDEILEAYLTIAPYGGNIEGILSASKRYFNKKPYGLEASQMALLVALPQSPEANRPDRQAKRSKKARDKVLTYAKDKGIISSYAYTQALNSPLPTTLHPLPRYAGHIASKVLKPHSFIVETTLNESLQIQLEKWALGKAKSLDKKSTLAVLVVRNADASIQAYLGSHDRFSKRVSGYIDMITAIRSPASTLKPFIYAKGFEKHLIHPNTIIRDEKTRFGDYMPHNFSNDYIGEVTINEALQKSLNIPAVKVLQRIGVEDFLSHIDHFTEGKLFIPKGKATLPIALGGMGLSMWQLTALYVGLANDGASYPLYYLKKEDNTTKNKKQLFSPKVSKMTTAILRQIKAPQGFTNQGQNIAYKTGTSYGYRDAWTIAYSKEYTVSIWVGKPDNSPQIKHTGSNTASPLAFEVFSILEALKPQNHWQYSPYYLGQKSPIALEYFDKNQKISKKSFVFISPQDNSRFMSAGCSDAIVELEMQEGKAPYYWYIDDTLQKDKEEVTQLSIPLKHGSHTIQVIDSSGDIISRNIWVNKPEC